MSRIISTVVTLIINLKVKVQHEFFTHVFINVSIYSNSFKGKLTHLKKSLNLRDFLEGSKYSKTTFSNVLFLTFKEDESNVFMNKRCWGIVPQFSLHIFDISNRY